MLQAILDGQVSLRKDIQKVGKKVKRNGERIDKLGFQLAELADDAPTREEYDDLEKRVTGIESQITSN